MAWEKQRSIGYFLEWASEKDTMPARKLEMRST